MVKLKRGMMKKKNEGKKKQTEKLGAVVLWDEEITKSNVVADCLAFNFFKT